VNKKYTDEFKNDAMELVLRSGRTISEVAEDLGISHWTLREWYKRIPMAKKQKRSGIRQGASNQPAEESPEKRLARLEREMAKLRKDTETLRMEREILKKAATFFAKESE
jgi:transposase